MHLKIFGSLCYRHVPDERSTKLEDKSEPVILVGYHPTKSYRLYDPVTEKLMVSRDVIVREAESWDWNQGVERTKVGPMQALMQFDSDEVNPS